MRPQLTFIALASLVAACSIAPSPTPAPSPPVECDDLQFGTAQPETILGCEEAVAVAMTALPAFRPPIVRIQFGWGIYCPYMSCPIPAPSNGVVVFTFSRPLAGGSTGAYVQIARDPDGRVRLATPLTPIDS